MKMLEESDVGRMMQMLEADADVGKINQVLGK